MLRTFVLYHFIPPWMYLFQGKRSIDKINCLKQILKHVLWYWNPIYKQNVFQNLFQTIHFIYSPFPLKEIISRSYEMVQDKRTKHNSEIWFLFFVRLFYRKLQILEITETMQDPLMTKLLALLCALFLQLHRLKMPTGC